MLNDTETFMVAFAVMAIVLGGLVVFVDIPFGKNMPKIA